MAVVFGWLQLGLLVMRRPAWLGPALLLASVPLAWFLQRERCEALREYVDVRAEGYRNGHRALADWLSQEAAEPGDTIALMDIGMVGYHCERQRILDLTGLTDRFVAKSPGGFLTKRYDPSYVFDREPRFLVLVYSGPGAGSAEPPPDVPLVPWTPMEARIAEHPAFLRWYRRGWRESPLTTGPRARPSAWEQSACSFTTTRIVRTC